jgi:deoxyribonuclease V
VKHTPLHGWNVSVGEAAELQRRLRERLVLRAPEGLAVRRVAGADLSLTRGSDRCYAGIVVLDADTLETLEESGATAPLTFPYVPGFLSFRELPALERAWAGLEIRPDVLIFDGQGYAHPRRFGLACHGGLLFDIPSIGCAKSLLVGTHGPLAEARGSTAELVHRGEVVGAALRLRAGARPVYVSPGHLMDLPTALDIVLRASVGYREPETTRRSHRLVNQLRVAGSEAARRGGGGHVDRS